LMSLFVPSVAAVWHEGKDVSLPVFAQPMG